MIGRKLHNTAMHCAMCYVWPEDQQRGARCHNRAERHTPSIPLLRDIASIGANNCCQSNCTVGMVVYVRCFPSRYVCARMWCGMAPLCSRWCCGNLQVEQGFALVDIIREIHVRTVSHQFPNDVLSHLFIKLGDVEYRCASATNDRLQLSSLVGAFQQVREQLVQMAS